MALVACPSALATVSAVLGPEAVVYTLLPLVVLVGFLGAVRREDSGFRIDRGSLRDVRTWLISPMIVGVSVLLAAIALLVISWFISMLRTFGPL